jgi:lysophospholipase L1-like esterase
MEYRTVANNNRRKHRGTEAIRFDHVKIPFCLILACIVGLAGCSPQMQIERIEPDSSNVGDIVVIQGYGFGPDQGASTVLFPSGQTAEILAWNNFEIAAIVPQGVPFGYLGVTVNVMEPDLPRFDSSLLLVEADPIQYRILAFGDSITLGVGTAYGGYTYYLENRLDAEEGSTVVINAGVGAELTFEGLERFESTLTKWNDLQTVLLLEGTNDVTDSSGAGPVDSIVSNLREMISIARDDHGLQVVLGTLLPRLSYSGDVESPTTSELVVALRDLAVEEDVLLADHYQNFVEMAQWEDYFTDTLHPNDQGYQALADSWVQGALEYLFP